MKAILLGLMAMLGLTACQDDGCIDRRCQTTIATGIDYATGRVVTMPVTTCICVEYEAPSE